MAKRFSTIEKWLLSNPSEEEKTKVLLLIHKGATSQTRKELYEKQRYLLKLQSFSNHCKKLGFTEPKDNLEAIARTKKEISELQKELPVITKKEKVKEEIPQELESAAISGE